MNRSETLHVDKPWGWGPVREPLGEREHATGVACDPGMVPEPPARLCRAAMMNEPFLRETR
jgi:hypothetical protein